MGCTKELIILGAGGNSIDVLDTVNEINSNSKRTLYKCIGFLDDDRNKWGKEVHGVKILGPIDSVSDFESVYFVFTVGSPFNFWYRDLYLRNINVPLEKFETIIHPTSAVSQLSELGRGTVVLQNVTVASDVHIGNHAMILPNSVISHNDRIGDYTIIAGGASVSGNVNIGKSCYLGANSSIIGNIHIGSYCLIGMGSVILGNVPSNSVYVGNPGKFLRHVDEGRLTDSVPREFSHREMTMASRARG